MGCSQSFFHHCLLLPAMLSLKVVLNYIILKVVTQNRGGDQGQNIFLQGNVHLSLKLCVF